MDPPSAHKPHAYNPPSLPIPPPTYSQVSIVPLFPISKLITLAGQVGLDTHTSAMVPNFAGQVRQAHRNVLAGLRSAGASPRDIVQVRHYIVHGTGMVGVESEDKLTEAWGELWMEFMDKEGEGHRPPDTVVGVASLATKEILYECEVWAVVHEA